MKMPNCVEGLESFLENVTIDPPSDDAETAFDGLSAKGDLPGHEFRGNQWTEGQGGGQESRHLVEAPLIVYHGTSVKLVDSILEKGIIPSQPVKEGHYAGAFGVENQPKAVYGTIKEDDAYFWAANAYDIGDYKGRENLVLFEVGVSVGEAKPDEKVSGAVYVERTITPSEIRAVIFVTRERPLRPGCSWMRQKKWVVVKRERKEVVGGLVERSVSVDLVMYVPVLVEEQEGENK